MAKKKKEVNKELVAFAVEARKQNLSYGELQVLETWRMLREEREKGKEGGGSGESKRISSAG